MAGRFFARFPPCAGLFILALLLAGCATPPQTRALLEGPGGLPRRVELSQVPFYPQESHQCGPASLAMALQAAGVATEPDALTPQVYLPGREGSLQVEMLAGARRNGLVAVELAPRLPDLLAELAAGTPVIVLQNNGLAWVPLWHYAVAIGYDLDRAEIVLRSGLERRLALPLGTFERTWARGGHWAMLALPPERLPASVGEQAYLAAVAALEKAGQPARAQTAYKTALERWPDSLVALMGLGNTAYARGDLAAAVAAFRRAAQAHPDSAPAFNNLAQVLAEQGRYAEALENARRAVDLGGPHQAASRSTLDAILRKVDKGR